jgi:hypothetical protein
MFVCILVVYDLKEAKNFSRKAIFGNALLLLPKIKFQPEYIAKQNRNYFVNIHFSEVVFCDSAIAKSRLHFTCINLVLASRASGIFFL